MPNLRVLILSAKSWKFLTGQSVLLTRRVKVGARRLPMSVTELMSIVGPRGVIVFTLVEISVNGLVLQLFKALYFLGFSGVLLQCLTGG